MNADQRNQKTSSNDSNHKALNSHARQRQRIQARRQAELYNKADNPTKNVTPQTKKISRDDLSSNKQQSKRQLDLQAKRTVGRSSDRKYEHSSRQTQSSNKQSKQHQADKRTNAKKQIRTLFGLTFTGNLKQDWQSFSSKERRKFILLSVIAFLLAAMLLFCLIEAITTPALDADKLTLTSGAQILDKNGELYQTFETKEYREIVSLDQIPVFVQKAFVDIEDQRFYSHAGVDIKGLGRAVLGVFASASLEGPGGSTITQQLIKLTHLSSEKTISRKIHEFILALELERKWSKEQILEAYLNKINFAQTWGIQAAAKTYFGKDVSELTLAQAAMLAAMPKSPYYFEPLCWNEEGLLIRTEDGRCALNENNRDRAIIVLNKMLELGDITAEECNEAKQQIQDNNVGLTFNPQSTTYSSFTDALYEVLLHDLQSKLHMSEDEAALYIQNEGITIYSTIDQDVQSAMEEAAENDDLFPAQSGTAAEASAALSADTGETIDLIPQVGMTVIDNATGGVAGMVGNRGEKNNLSLNRATQRFQPGSSTKPLTTYGPGLDSKSITLGTVFADTPINIGDWRPHNDGGGYSGNLTVRNGLRQSINTIAAQVCMQTGLETCASYGEKLGLYIDRKNDTDINAAALALGGYSHGQSTLVMASAYSTFVNKGVHKSYSFYTKVTDKKGDIILQTETNETKVFSEETTYLITDVLQQAIKGGTTTIYCDQPIAGKTGTTDERLHAWICGYTPYYSMSVWYGYDQNYVETSQGDYNLYIGVTGGSMPGPAAMFAQVMNAINNDKPAASFSERPDSIVSATIDTQSGLLASDLSGQAGDAATELFMKGTVPSKYDDSHYTVTICNESGCLANEYCTDVSEKVFYKATNHFPAGVSGSSMANEAPTEECSIHTKPVLPKVTDLVNKTTKKNTKKSN